MTFLLMMLFPKKSTKFIPQTGSLLTAGFFLRPGEIASSGRIVFLRSDANEVCLGKSVGGIAGMASPGSGQAGAGGIAGAAPAIEQTAGVGVGGEKLLAQSNYQTG